MLYLVGTPIGNLGDMSPRAVEVLREADIIAAEDTRHTAPLLRAFEIDTPQISYHEHNCRERGQELLHLMQEGKTVALVTDAGMPAISDPGQDLAALCHENNIPVSVVPGPSAFISALAVSGFPSDRFTFYGFLPPKQGDRRRLLEELSGVTHTRIFYEAPHRLLRTLTDMLEVWGDAEVCAVRELTKKFEEVKIGSISELISYFEQPKGEFVLIVRGAEKRETSFAETPQEQVRRLMEEGLDKNTAIKQTAKERGVPKREIYALMIQ